MGVKRRNRPLVAYGIDNALQNLAPQPIIAERNPGVNDTAEIGTVWINDVNSSAWILTNVIAGQGQWQFAAVYAGSGAPTFVAPQGALYTNLTGNSTTTRLYVNTTGSTTWAHFTASA